MMSRHRMKVLNFLTAGNIGGIECLCRDIGIYSNYENGFCFLFGKGDIYDDMVARNLVTYDLTQFKRNISLGRLLQLRRIATVGYCQSGGKSDSKAIFD